MDNQKIADALARRALAKRWLKRAGYVTLGAVGTYVTACLGAAFPLSQQLIRPRLKRLPQLKSDKLRRFIAARGVLHEAISFRSFDDTRLDGWWFTSSEDPRPETRPTVIALHGVSKNRTDMVRFAIVLVRAGMNVLLFDGRGHGESDRRFVTYGFFERRDVEAAIDVVVARGVSERRIGLAGVSMGAAIALQVAARDPRVHAVWTDSPFASLHRVTMDRLRFWTRLPRQPLVPVHWAALQVAQRRGRFDVSVVDPCTLASKITCPVQIVHGDADTMIEVGHSVHIFDALASPEKHLWIIPGAAHGRGFRRAKREYHARLVTFFERALSTQHFS
jgi:dipeptidyl aminopeptidase/acylaminoacyl peptidase